MGLHKVFFNNTPKKSSKRKDQYEPGYQIMKDYDAILYQHGELFIERCLRQTPPTDFKQIDVDLNFYQYGTNQTNENNKLSKFEMEIIRFYARDHERKRSHSMDNNKAMLSRRRNAVCEQSMEERIGLGLCLQRHQHNEYMMDYEM